MCTAAVFELYSPGEYLTVRSLNEVSKTGVKWTLAHMDKRKRRRSAELFLLFQAGLLGNGQHGDAEFVLLQEPWQELGGHLVAVTEGHALQLRLDQMFFRTPNN